MTDYTGGSMDDSMRQKAQKPKRRKRGNQHVSRISKPAQVILERMAAGETLTAHRTFPGPWHYAIGVLSLGSAGTASSSAALSLVPLGMIVAVNPELDEDFLRYDITEMGRQYLQEGDPAHDETQLDWTK